jgi:Kinesin motor domain
MGPNPTTAVSPDDVDAGVIPRALTAIFAKLQEKRAQQAESGADLEYQVSVQFLELYGEEIRDLLVTTTTRSSHEKLTIRDLGIDEPEVVGATQTPVTSAAQALQCLAHGMLRRVTGATAMNESSSRSHAILSVCIEQAILFKSTSTREASTNTDEEQIQVTRSKFNFVDLAGAERQKRTGASGKRLKEGIDINKGLSNLGNVISALGDPKKRGRTHVPYRDAKLTRLLKGSLGGNHKTLMIACVSPAAVNMSESLNCLRYANRAKNIQNKAVVNVDANTRLVQELQGQVAALASDLLKAIDGNTSKIQFTRDNLLTLADGGTVGSVAKTLTPSKAVTSTNLDVHMRLKDTEQELFKMQSLLRQTQTYHDDAEIELLTVRAQNNLFDAQISALVKEGSNGYVISDVIEQSFMEKAVAYENEIATLRQRLRETDTAKNFCMLDNDKSIDDIFVNHDHDGDSLILREESALDVSRNNLMRIRTALLTEKSKDLLISRDFDSISTPTAGDIETEDKVDQDKADTLANRYLKPDDRDDDALSKFDARDHESTDRKLNQFSIEIEELSRSIETKERLIQQMKRNKEREAVCRTRDIVNNFAILV